MRKIKKTNFYLIDIILVILMIPIYFCVAVFNDKKL